MKKIRTRFAPSPTGFMHLGGMRTALYNYLFTKSQGGDFILRIEDTDRERFVEGATEVIYSSLKQGNMIYDEGPDIGGNYGPYIQSERMALYQKYALELIEKGGAYYCFCSKERLESLTDENGNRKYDKHCLKLSKEEVETRLKNGESYVIRQNIPTEGTSVYEDLIYGTISIENQELEDNILIKSDGMPTYNFANVIDDHLMEISHVIRGTEYLSSTPKYNFMYDAFGWERPTYIHLPVIMKDATRKLSKRYGDANFDDFTKKGFLPEAIINYIALLGWSPKENVEKMSMEEMIKLFSLDGISKSPSIFDEVKLRWLNSEYIKSLDDETYYNVAMPFLQKSSVYGKYDSKLMLSLLKTRIEALGEIPEKLAFLDDFTDYDTMLFCHKKMKTDEALSLQVLPLVIDTLNNCEWTHDGIHDSLINLATNNGYKNGQILYPARIALTGKESTPGGAIEMCLLLGKEESLRRINHSIFLLKAKLGV